MQKIMKELKSHIPSAIMDIGIIQTCCAYQLKNPEHQLFTDLNRKSIRAEKHLVDMFSDYDIEVCQEITKRMMQKTNETYSKTLQTIVETYADTAIAQLTELLYTEDTQLQANHIIQDLAEIGKSSYNVFDILPKSHDVVKCAHTVHMVNKIMIHQICIDIKDTTPKEIACVARAAFDAIYKNQKIRVKYWNHVLRTINEVGVFDDPTIQKYEILGRLRTYALNVQTPNVDSYEQTEINNLTNKIHQFDTSMIIDECNRKHQIEYETLALMHVIFKDLEQISVHDASELRRIIKIVEKYKKESIPKSQNGTRLLILLKEIYKTASILTHRQ